VYVSPSLPIGRTAVDSLASTSAGVPADDCVASTGREPPGRETGKDIDGDVPDLDRFAVSADAKTEVSTDPVGAEVRAVR